MELLDASFHTKQLHLYHDQLSWSGGHDDESHAKQQAYLIARQRHALERLYEEGCYLKKRARVFSSFEDRIPLHDHLKAFISHAMQRRAEVPLPGYPFPTIDDIIASDPVRTSRKQAAGCSG